MPEYADNRMLERYKKLPVFQLRIVLKDVLATEHRKQTEQAIQSIVDNINSDLKVAPARIRVLSARPSRNWGELHGLYEPSDARITVWMRTAKHKKVVAFRTFLRTLSPPGL